MAILQVLLIVAGFAVLMKSADEAIRRLILISKGLGVSELAVSFVVGGTLAVLPELSIGVNSALDGAASFGFGIIFGSNIADLTLVLGAVAFFSGGIRLGRPAAQNSKWYLLAVSLPLVLLLMNGGLPQMYGLVLLAAYAVYAIVFFRDGRVAEKTGGGSASPAVDLLVCAVCFIAVLLSGNVIAHAAEALGAALGIPVFFLGIVLAVGTCLPELTMALKAAKLGHGGLAFGNILGNVVADCTLTLGVIALISPIKPDAHLLALGSGAFMVLSMAIVVYLLWRKNGLSRTDGLLLLSLYPLFTLVQMLAEKLALGA